jgi:hypothetical protein
MQGLQASQPGMFHAKQCNTDPVCAHKTSEKKDPGCVEVWGEWNLWKIEFD